MVKNTIGGKKGKMLANKRSGSSVGANSKLTLSSHPDEIFVCVSKVFGGGIFEVIDNQFNIFKAHLRGKMRGHNKRHNFVSLFSILLVGIRSDLSSSNDCDILFVYDDHDILSLSLLPNLNISNILHFHFNHCNTTSYDDNYFSISSFHNTNLSSTTTNPDTITISNSNSNSIILTDNLDSIPDFDFMQI